MPIYEYQCPECGHVFEEWVNINSASDEAPCPQCGQAAVHIISNTAFVLKGGGWYVTDYGSRKNDGHKEGQDSSVAAPPAAASAPAATVSDTKTADAKVADTKTPEAKPAPSAAAPAAPSAASA